MRLSFSTICRCAVLLSAPLLVAVSAAHAQELKHFLTRDGDQIMDGDRPYRFMSFNIPNLLVVEDAYEFTGQSPWRWPDAYEIEDALETIRQMGGQVARTYTISVRREGSDMGETVHVLGRGQFNEEGFRVLDKVLETANRKGVRLIIPLVDNWKWMGGVPQYEAFRGKPEGSFWTDPQLIDDFKQTIAHVVNRRNTITGQLYKDDKAIFGWETGNEIDAPPEWTREIAAYIKSLDRNHLVIDGRSLHGISPESLGDPSIDVVTTHHYPGRTRDFVPLIRAAHAASKGKKPYFVGEFGFVESSRLTPVIEAVVADGIPGALIWSLRFHRREGGFYWHMEVNTGANFYKAYHWPGFASGSAYEEQPMLDLLRRKAFEIRGQQAPAIQPPAAPRLLPIEHPAKISWQGSTGASSYDVERATAAEGPWEVVGRDVSDAEVQYRPLFADSRAEVGRPHFYRVVARNSAGDSPPSNVVGPVVADYQMLVDELVDLSLVEQSAGELRVAAENARQFQEDCHRLAMSPGSSITYRVDRPIRAWRVYAFASREDAPIEISGSAGGESFGLLPAERQLFGSGQGDYGYALPVLIEGEPPERNSSWLRIAVPANAGNSPPNGSTASSEEKDGSLLEISRVEIDF